MKIRWLYAGMVLCMLVLPVPLAAQENWHLEKTRDGIEVYTRLVPGTSIYAYKGVGVMNARIEEVAELIRDVPAVPEWIADMAEARIVTKKDNYTLTTYNRQNLPWPVCDRDMILSCQSVLDFDKGRVTIFIDAVKEPMVPLRDGCVRITDMHASYYLEYLDRTHTRVTYSAWIDPAGSLPAALVNLQATKMPYQTLKGMRRMLKQEKYIRLGKESPDRALIEEQLAKGNLKP